MSIKVFSSFISLECMFSAKRHLAWLQYITWKEREILLLVSLCQKYFIPTQTDCLSVNAKNVFLRLESDHYHRLIFIDLCYSTMEFFWMYTSFPKHKSFFWICKAETLRLFIIRNSTVYYELSVLALWFQLQSLAVVALSNIVTVAHFMKCPFNNVAAEMAEFVLEVYIYGTFVIQYNMIGSIQCHYDKLNAALCHSYSTSYEIIKY